MQWCFAYGTLCSMWGFLHSIYRSVERSRYKVLGLICFAAFFICLRVLLEAISSGLFMKSDKILIAFVCIQYLLWFGSTYLMVLACFRYVARVPLRLAVYLLLSTVILLIPILSAALVGAHTQFVFLSYNDPGVLQSIATLMYTSPVNHNLFYEIVLVVIGVPIIAYFFCRDILRSLATLVCIYGALAFIQAFLYVCSVQQCVFVVGSDIPISIFLCFYSIVLTGGWIGVLFFPELREHLSADDTIFTQTNLMHAFVLIIPYGIVAMLMSGNAIDLAFLFLSYFISFYAGLFIYKHWREKSLLGLNAFLAIYEGLILATFALTCFRFFVG